MNAAIQHLFTNWKSTVQSVLTTTFAVTAVLMGSSVIKPHTAALLVTVNGVAKVLLGLTQTDGIQVPAGSTIDQSTRIQTPAPPVSETASNQ